MKICIVLSTRPEIIKLAPIIKLLQSKKKNFFLINTNQHHIKNMSDIFFNFFDIPEPKYNIRAPNKTYGGFFSKTILDIEKILFKERPNYLIVQGDTNTAFAGCFAASILNRKYFEYKILWSIAPFSLLGVIIGTILFKFLNLSMISIFIGMISLLYVLFNYLIVDTKLKKIPFYGSKSFWGALAGFTSFALHSGGLPLNIYFMTIYNKKVLKIIIQNAETRHFRNRVLREGKVAAMVAEAWAAFFGRDTSETGR